MSRICIGSLIALGLSAWLGSACAMSRIGEAEVRLQDGQPCFTISEKEAKRGPSSLLQAVILSDSSTKPVNTVWSMAPDLASSMKMSAANCVVYGQILDGATASPASARALQAGRVYRVYLNTRSSDPYDPTRGVRADNREPSTRSATAAMKSAAAWQALSPEACMPLSVEDRARLPRPWKPYAEAVRRCELAAPGAQSQIALISVFVEEYYRGRPANAPWEDFPKPLLVDRDFRCVGGLRELFPHDQPRALTLRAGLWRKGIPQEIHGQVHDPAVGGGYALPVLRWSEVDHRYREASGAVSSDSSCSHF